MAGSFSMRRSSTASTLAYMMPFCWTSPRQTPTKVSAHLRRPRARCCDCWAGKPTALSPAASLLRRPASRGGLMMLLLEASPSDQPTPTSSCCGSFVQRSRLLRWTTKGVASLNRILCRRAMKICRMRTDLGICLLTKRGPAWSCGAIRIGILRPPFRPAVGSYQFQSVQPIPRRLVLVMASINF